MSRGVSDMNNCFVSGLAVLVVMSTSTASVAKTLINLRVQDPTVCWVPDVEFPVPCDEDDD
jgi:hypothetical protein